MRTGPLAVGGWIVAATLTLGVSWSAVQVVRSAVAPENLAVASGDALPVPDETGSRTATATAAPSPRPSPSTTVTGRAVSDGGVGGTVVVRCVDGVPRFVSRIPRQGFSVDVDDSPGEVRFTSEDHRTEIKASCSGSEPSMRVEEKDERGGDDNSGPGGGNSGPGD